jgi:hypothetical protein
LAISGSDPLQDGADLDRRPLATACRRNAASIERSRDATPLD